MPMTVSVVIPAYNAARTLRQTIDAVLAQTVRADEILVFNDGSKDETEAVLQSYGSALTFFTQPNGGVARARNFLCSKVSGDVIAFLDADDVWHPRYLEVQLHQLAKHPQVAASFTDHVDIVGTDKYVPEDSLMQAVPRPVVYEPRQFIEQYDHTPMRFQMSCCCLPRKMLAQLGPEPFFTGASGADDSSFHNRLPLLGPMVHAGLPLVAYRIIPSSISANQLRMAILVVTAIDSLEQEYRQPAHAALFKPYRAMVASRKRHCGKFLMGSGDKIAARQQFRDALKASSRPSSVVKSLRLLVVSYLPKFLQPRWPGSWR
jgi:glycosyltransferase involved in cell wall biosynthesis